jgi:hypothetical protein
VARILEEQNGRLMVKLQLPQKPIREEVLARLNLDW